MIFVKLCRLFYSMCSSLSSSNRLTIPVIVIVFTENVWPVYVCLDLYSNTSISTSISTSSRSSFGRYSCISSICIWKSSDTDVDLGLDLYSTCKAYPPPNLRSSDTVPSISFLLAGGAVAVVDVTVDVAGIPLVVAVLAGAGTDATN